MFADLHTHSVYSDGWFTPEELCKRAVSRGVSLLSITDHDTLSGEEAKRAAAKKYGLFYVTGWEISAYYRGEKMHVLGYGCALNDAYVSFMNERKQGALQRVKIGVEVMQKLGVPVTEEEVLSERSAPDLPVHTMHLARAIAKHLSITDSEAYLRFLNRGKPAHSDFGRPTPKQAIDCIHACGGIACIAHPGRITLDFAEREEIIRALAAYGMDGIECVYTTHTEEERGYFTRLARELNLFITGGSDTHFEDRTHTVGSPKFEPEGELLSRLGLR